MSDPTEPGFATFIYTDCRPGQGLNRSAGLQFQARSRDADQAAMPVVQRSLLYEAPDKWMRERRPVEAYPPSFAHVWDGWLATAAGRYLGKEANGSREGNQLTHSIVTREPAAYGLIRPAQLFRAPFWTGEPAASTDCPPVPAGWEPGPFDAEQAQKFVLDTPDGPALLLALLSALERLDTPQKRRILFVATEPEPVLRWIAAATLLLPQRRALAVGFKVFTPDPARAVQPVVAVHPDWDATTARVGNDLGYAVFDLVNGGCSEVEPTPSARRWVELFCTLDPFDVVDVIEVAAESTLDDQDAAMLGRTAILRERPTEQSARTLLGWLRDTPRDLLAAHRGTIVDLLAEGVDQWPLDVLLLFDEVSRSGQVPEDRMAPVRLALIRAELHRAHRHAEVTDVALPALPDHLWHPAYRDAAQASVIEALSTARPAAFDAILRVAARFDLPVRVGDIAEPAHRFVLHWADHPDLGYDVTAWPCGQELDDLLADELSGRIAAKPTLSPVIGDDWWRGRVKHLPGPHTHLDRAVAAASMVHMSEAKRRQLADYLIRDALGRPNPEQAVGDVVSLLWSRATPTYGELRDLRSVLPERAPVDPRVFVVLRHDLESGELTDDALALARAFVELGVWLPSRGVTEMLSADRTLQRLRDEAVKRTLTEQPPSNFTDKLKQLPARLIALRADELVGAMLRTESPRTVLAALEAVSIEIGEAYLRRLRHELREAGSLSHLTTAFFLGVNSQIGESYRKSLLLVVERWVNDASNKLLKRAEERIDAVSKDYGRVWRDFVSDFRRGPAGRMMRRLGG
ncbi:GTPase-associated protein 1-related protein [Phytohabitans rumicis]|uniref:Uncharacterized protein n=1 Tax=Phytohabitans rumicis TaxID=1076125 RepID=A0A6V8L1G3_9ACTN|nr:GTPase-associated protein 1-related protein [Phytohabitans rumicis]GFJ86565.1 hypothetical protein Prum_002070 [Phytohabitans rumicis]